MLIKIEYDVESWDADAQGPESGGADEGDAELPSKWGDKVGTVLGVV